ncbi:hypothetical protein [Maricaulis sp.]|uniref:hypothetical protein n=1 Tax=Maricaulis sp. TaxID=1486257 RepID=UPI002617E931|nr:hypothetical protein [Maricaulis sp.]
MQDHDWTDGEGAVPSLVSLALFAIVFVSAIAAVEFGAGLIEPVKAALADLPRSIKAGALAVFILGVMAVVRIGVLLTGGRTGGGRS